MLEFISSGLDVASWSYDVSVVGIFVNQISRRGSGKVGCINDTKDTGPIADPCTMLAEMFSRVEVEPPYPVQ